jgi:acetoin utilization protein AcuB
MKPSLRVRDYMTAVPHSIGLDQPLSVAHSMMREHAIRHLPVLAGGKLVGILSDRDLNSVETLSDVDPTVVAIEEAMTSDVHVASPETPLSEVANEMAEHRYGSTVVIDSSKVVGIFTTVDACRALADVLAGRS